MKWYTCCNEAALQQNGECLIAAVVSCLARTRLKPHLVYDGVPNSLTEYLATLGVTVLYRQLSFLDAIETHRGSTQINYDWLIGNALKFDIANIEQDDSYILYTDTDVLFHTNIDVNLSSQPLAAVREIVVDGEAIAETDRAFNAGVMLLNVAFMRSLHKIFRKKCIELASGILQNSWYDQGILNSVCHGLWLPLSQRYNHRPYYSLHTPPIITHFQFVKPADIEKLNGDAVATVPIAWHARRHQDIYNQLRAIVLRYQTPAAREALLRACPTASLSPL